MAHANTQTHTHAHAQIQTHIQRVEGGHSLTRVKPSLVHESGGMLTAPSNAVSQRDLLSFHYSASFLSQQYQAIIKLKS